MSDTATFVDESDLLARVEAPQGEGVEVLDAATRDVIGRVAQHTPADVDEAIARAKAAQPPGSCRGTCRDARW